MNISNVNTNTIH